MATIDLKLKSYDELQFEIMKLTTDNYLKQQQLDQSTNNWNELEEYIKDMLFTTPHENQMLDFILDKMNEIKEKNNEKLH